MRSRQTTFYSTRAYGCVLVQASSPPTEENLHFFDVLQAVSPLLKMVGLRSFDVDTAKERGLIPGKT